MTFEEREVIRRVISLYDAGTTKLNSEDTLSALLAMQSAMVDVERAIKALPSLTKIDSTRGLVASAADSARYATESLGEDVKSTANAGMLQAALNLKTAGVDEKVLIEQRDAELKSAEASMRRVTAYLFAVKAIGDCQTLK